MTQLRLVCDPAPQTNRAKKPTLENTVSLPESIVEALSTPEEARTPVQRKALASYHSNFVAKNDKTFAAIKKKVEEKGQFYTYEVYMNYSCVLLVADALERAASGDRAKLTAALESSTFAGHVMPYGPTKFVNGQNQGAAPANTQVLDGDIKVVLPAAFAQAKPVFPMPA